MNEFGAIVGPALVMQVSLAGKTPRTVAGKRNTTETYIYIDMGFEQWVCFMRTYEDVHACRYLHLQCLLI